MTKLNADHLLILQRKVLVIEKKDDQIVKLNSTIAALKNDLNDLEIKSGDLIDDTIEAKLKAKHFENKFEEANSIYKDEKKKSE